jgi:hypothetical protein
MAGKEEKPETVGRAEREVSKARPPEAVEVAVVATVEMAGMRLRSLAMKQRQ